MTKNVAIQFVAQENELATLLIFVENNSPNIIQATGPHPMENIIMNRQRLTRGSHFRLSRFWNDKKKWGGWGGWGNLIFNIIIIKILVGGFSGKPASNLFIAFFYIIFLYLSHLFLPPSPPTPPPPLSLPSPLPKRKRKEKSNFSLPRW